MRHELAPRLVDRYRRFFREKERLLTEACLQGAISSSEDCQDCASIATVPTAISNARIRLLMASFRGWKDFVKACSKISSSHRRAGERKSKEVLGFSSQAVSNKQGSGREKIRLS